MALIVSSLGVTSLCFLGKLIRLRREYTELFIPIIGAIIFLLIFQLGFVSLIEKFNMINMVNDFLHLAADIAVSIVISQAIYILP